MLAWCAPTHPVHYCACNTYFTCNREQAHPGGRKRPGHYRLIACSALSSSVSRLM